MALTPSGRAFALATMLTPAQAELLVDIMHGRGPRLRWPEQSAIIWSTMDNPFARWVALAGIDDPETITRAATMWNKYTPDHELGPIDAENETDNKTEGVA